MNKIVELIKPFRQVLTKKGFGHFETLIQGFILLIGFFSIERIGKLLDKKPKTIREWLSNGKIDMKKISQVMLKILLKSMNFPLVHGCLPTVVDDSKTNKPHGKKMEGRSKQYNETVDVSIKNKREKGALAIWGHCWVTIGLMLFNKSFPIWAHGHLSEKKSKEFGIKEYLTKPQLLLEMLKKIDWGCPLLLIGDIAYGCKTVLNSIYHVLSRIRSNGVVFDFPEEETTKKRGRPKKYGKKHKLGEWFKEVSKDIIIVNGKVYEYFTQIVLLKYCDRPVRLIMAKGEKDKKPWFLFTTLIDMTPEEMIQWYNYRWGIEVSFKDLKGLMGMQDYHLRNWSSIQNYIQICIISYSILKVWLELYNHDLSIEEAKLSLKQDFIGHRIFRLVSKFIKTEHNSSVFDSIKKLVV